MNERKLQALVFGTPMLILAVVAGSEAFSLFP
jgi:hypothetical protein